MATRDGENLGPRFTAYKVKNPRTGQSQHANTQPRVLESCRLSWLWGTCFATNATNVTLNDNVLQSFHKKRNFSKETAGRLVLCSKWFFKTFLRKNCYFNHTYNTGTVDHILLATWLKLVYQNEAELVELEGYTIVDPTCGNPTDISSQLITSMINVFEKCQTSNQVINIRCQKWRAALPVVNGPLHGIGFNLCEWFSCLLVGRPLDCRSSLVKRNRNPQSRLQHWTTREETT